MLQRSLAILLVSFLYLFALPAFAQPTQVVNGRLLEQAGLAPVAGVRVLLQQDTTTYAATSDSLGYFSVTVPTGRYQLATHHLNFQPYVLKELAVHASRLSPLRILLTPRQEVLETVTVTAAPYQALPPLSSTTFSVEETQRTPGTFWDPARFVATAPGVSTVNDQANHLTVRGLPPWAVQWRLQGLPILNPNHLANAGTLYDRAAYAGGGVNILSGQLLDRSTFWQGHYPAAYGGALGGIFNMRLRDGTSDAYNHTLQASLLGLDAATEGPLGTKGASYLVNYRYSTVGLLSDLGVDFGNETIKFQDLSFHISAPAGRNGRLSLFGMGGLSKNLLRPLEDTTAWETEKDALEVTYKGKMAAIGASAETALRQRLSLLAALAYSIRQDTRSEEFSPFPLGRAYVGNDQLQEQLLAARLQLQGSYHLLQWQAGIEGSYLSSSGYACDISPQPTTYYNSTISQAKLAPYAAAHFSIMRHLTADIGVRYVYWPALDYSLTEPRLTLSWQVLPQVQLWAQAARTAQLPPSPLLLMQKREGVATEQLRPVKSLSFSLGLQWQLGEKLMVASETYLQQLDEVTASGTSPYVSALNFIDDLPTAALTALGEATLTGVHLQLHRPFHRGYFLKLNGTVQKTSFAPAVTGNNRLRYDPGWASTLLLGKEWEKEKEQAMRRIGIYTRSSLRGGYYLPKVDITGSEEAWRTRFAYSSSNRLPTYFTFDLRLSHIREKEEYTRTLSLDLQNVLARENISGYYYDRLLQEVRPLLQLGLIPVLSYRVEF